MSIKLHVYFSRLMLFANSWNIAVQPVLVAALAMDLFQPTSPMIMSGAKVQRLLLMPAHIWTLMTAFPTKESGWSVTWQAKDEMRTSLQNGKICRNTCCRCVNSFLQSSPMQDNFLPWNSNSLSSLAGREATCSFFRMADISPIDFIYKHFFIV